ncbi:MAG: hypothetical protein A2945_02685 [Candidatus Liptonbacteria bacterium RIFCSPLOWO2_01_FULL_52_25]|uniref:NADP-dependent oxidoreductase domain-containing protein n=1 Tax=Candidatus Liptonbacteria bacterium RIFCSPLOWO2_01_FULL_52_25 TaxID=1798650 RepID=A0A1G2CER8_9BACT|nr:MAG: hypothetical protein A2945_02685 [Candidatus Liptonbacteria bacterium RIFCSPLOWO2_01_FULL_52_25]
MRTKKLGRTGIEVSIVGLGTGNIGLPQPEDFAKQYFENPDGSKNYADENLGVATVHTALEGGVTLIDTAPLYLTNGRSEHIVGHALHERSDLTARCIVETKIGRTTQAGGFDHTYDAAMRSAEGSMKRLGVSHLPILHLHDPMGFPMDFVMSDKGSVGALRKLRAEGVVDNIGVAADNPATAADYIETGEFDVATVSGAWSLINQTAAKRILPAAEKHNVGIVITTAIERGLLATGELVQGVCYHQRNFTPELLAHVQKIHALCNEFDIPLLAAALQWVTRHPQVTTAIPGARTPEEARVNAAAGSMNILDEFWTELEPLVQHWDVLTGY